MPIGPEVPRFLRSWINTLTRAQANVLWLYLDENKYASHNIVECINELHHNLGEPPKPGKKIVYDSLTQRNKEV